MKVRYIIAIVLYSPLSIILLIQIMNKLFHHLRETLFIYRQLGNRLEVQFLLISTIL